MVVRKPTKKKGLLASAPPPYTSKIIKASALLDDTKTLLSHWEVDATVPENLHRIQRENVFAKASRSRVKDILAVFRQTRRLHPDICRFISEAVYDGRLHSHESTAAN